MKLYICHHTDNDGFMGAAVLYDHAINDLKIIDEDTKLIENTEFVKCNYGFDFTEFIDTLEIGDYVWIVDFSFEPDVFKRIVEKVIGHEWNGLANAEVKKQIVWIDHHDSAIKKYDSTRLFMDGVPGLRSTVAAGCELAWYWVNLPERLLDDYHIMNARTERSSDIHKSEYENYLIPISIALVGDWDTWSFNFPTTKLFNAGLRSLEADMTDPLTWYEMFLFPGRALGARRVADVIERGKIAQIVINNQFYMMSKKAFEFTDSKGRSWIALNSLINSSKVFGEEAEDKYDFMLTFSNYKNKYWNYSIYSTKYDTREVDFYGHHSEGHPGASGFEAEYLITDDIGDHVK